MTDHNRVRTSRCAFLGAIALGLAALPLRAATNAVYGGTYTNWPSY
ncbi:hypothetical protein GX586_06860 [bacterium]|nr:hypothetical protein [bacterium]